MRTYRNKKKWTRQGKKIFTRRRTFFFQTLLYQEKKDCDIPDSCLFVFSIPGVLVKLLLCSESAGSATVPFYPNFQAREQPRDQPGCYCLNRTTTAVLQKSTKCFLKKTVYLSWGQWERTIPSHLNHMPFNWRTNSTNLIFSCTDDH